MGWREPEQAELPPPPEAEWEVHFRQRGAKFVQSLREAAEEHLREQELLVSELLERAKQDFGGARRKEFPSFAPLPPIDLPSAPKELYAMPETPSTPSHSDFLTVPDLTCTFQMVPDGDSSPGGARRSDRMKSNTSAATSEVGDSRKSGLHTYLDTQMGDLTAGVMSSTHLSGMSPGAASYLHRCIACMQAFEEPERTGQLARIVTSTYFEIITLFVIVAASAFAIWMTNQLMNNPEILDSPGVVWADCVFLLFFTSELVLKLTVHRFYFFCNEDQGWNLLDSLIIIFSLVDFALNFTANGPALQDVKSVRALRALRISKSLRILRAVRLVSELRVLMMCIVTSFSVLFWCVLLLLLIQAGVSTALVQLVAGYVQEQRNQGTSEEELEPLISHFGTVQAGMLQLFMSTTGGVDWGAILDLVSRTGFVATVVYSLYVLFFFVAAWNIITSLFIEKAMKLAQPDNETQMLTKHKEDLQSFREIVKLLQDADANSTGTISLPRFQQYMQAPRFRHFFEFRDLEIKDAEMFFRLMSTISNSEEVPHDTFAHGCLRMKGQASVLDVQSLRIELKTTYLHLTQLCKQLSEDLNSIGGQLESHIDSHVETIHWIPKA